MRSLVCCIRQVDFDNARVATAIAVKNNRPAVGRPGGAGVFKSCGRVRNLSDVRPVRAHDEKSEHIVRISALANPAGGERNPFTVRRPDGVAVKRGVI